MLRAVRHRAFHDRSLSQPDYGRGLLGARIQQIPRRQLLRLHLAPADASLRRAAFHVLPEKRQFAASYHALLRIERQRPRHRRQMREQVARPVRDRLFFGGDQVPVVAIDVPFRPGEGAEIG